MDTSPLALAAPSLDRPLSRRQRRAAQTEALRVTLATLERALPVVLTLDTLDIEADDDTVRWDGFLDERALRVRRLMKRTIQLTKEATRLQTSQWQLQRLLHEHRVASRVLAGLVRDHDHTNRNEWARDVQRWRELTRRNFMPWAVDECHAELQVALGEIDRFQLSHEKQTTGVSFLGWRDQRRFDQARGTFQFEFHKTFRGFDVKDYLKVAWDSFADPMTFYKVNVGPDVRVVDGLAIGHRSCAHFEVLQRLDAHTVITRAVRRYTGMDVDVHITYLVSRIKTEVGYTQCMRSICCPGLMQAFDGPKDMWASNFIWSQWELLDKDDETAGYKLRIGGSMRARDVSYAQQWMLEALGCVFRSERLATGRQLITSD